MKKHIIRYASFAFAILGMVSCSEEQETALRPQDAKSTPLTFLVSHPGQTTRATETSFEQNDRIGLYVADAKAQLEIGGNLVNNEALTYDGSKWAAARTLYWDKGIYTAYAYYPYLEDVSSITDQPFSVVLDQSTAKSKEAMGGYEASDLLFASSKNISASASPIPLNFKHIMSKLKIRLIKGEDFEGDMPTTAQVTIHNTKAYCHHRPAGRSGNPLCKGAERASSPIRTMQPAIPLSSCLSASKTECRSSRW